MFTQLSKYAWTMVNVFRVCLCKFVYGIIQMVERRIVMFIKNLDICCLITHSQMLKKSDKDNKREKIDSVDYSQQRTGVVVDLRFIKSTQFQPHVILVLQLLSLERKERIGTRLYNIGQCYQWSNILVCQKCCKNIQREFMIFIGGYFRSSMTCQSRVIIPKALGVHVLTFHNFQA